MIEATNHIPFALKYRLTFGNILRFPPAFRVEQVTCSCSCSLSQIHLLIVTVDQGSSVRTRCHYFKRTRLCGSPPTGPRHSFTEFCE